MNQAAEKSGDNKKPQQVTSSGAEEKQPGGQKPPLEKLAQTRDEKTRQRGQNISGRSLSFTHAVSLTFSGGISSKALFINKLYN